MIELGETRRYCKNCGKFLPSAGCRMNPKGRGQGTDWHHPEEYVVKVRLVEEGEGCKTCGCTRDPVTCPECTSGVGCMTPRATW